MNDIHWDEVDAIMSFLAAATDSNLVSLSLHYTYTIPYSPHEYCYVEYNNVTTLCLFSARRDIAVAVEAPDQCSLPLHCRRADVGERSPSTCTYQSSEHVC